MAYACQKEILQKFISNETRKFLLPWNSYVLSPSRNCSPWAKNKEQFRENEHKSWSAPAFPNENEVKYYKHSLVMKRGNFYHRGSLTYFHQVETVPHGRKTGSNLGKMNLISSAPLFLMKMKFQ